MTLEGYMWRGDIALQFGGLPIIGSRNPYVAHEHFTETVKEGYFRDKSHRSVPFNACASV